MKKVLLVEDDPFMRDLTSVKLAEHDYAVVTCTSGESVIAMMQSEKPDVVLLDLDLPDLPGTDIVKYAKADASISSIPIIIFSNNDDPSIHTAISEFGITDFFVKATTSFDDLLVRIKELTA
jgi:DNA-binding response OmpR family regulator